MDLRSRLGKGKWKPLLRSTGSETVALPRPLEFFSQRRLRVMGTQGSVNTGNYFAQVVAIAAQPEN